MSEADSKFADSLVSQDALDELMKEAEEQQVAPSAPDEESRDLDLVSPEDIEKLLETTTDGSDEADDEESDLDLISQDDIDALISGEELNGAGSALAEGPDDALISQDDINALLGGTELAVSPDDTAGDMDDSLISQDDIDALLSGGDAPAGEIEDDEMDSSLISQDDIDNLLKDAGSDDAEEEEKLVSQEEIDNLLTVDETKETVTVSSETGENIVSQDDIDKLLNADIDDDFDDDSDDDAFNAVSDQVILEKGEEETQDGDKKGGRKWFTPKVLAAVSAVLVLIAVAGFGVTFFSGEPEKEIVETEVVDDASEEYADAGLEEEIEEAESFADTAFVTVELKDFVVPAPLSMKDISYISLDLTLEIVDVSSDPIKGYEPFFRNIIYEVLNKALELQSESRIIEADLIRMIKNALNDALSEGAVDTVSFTEFVMT